VTGVLTISAGLTDVEGNQLVSLSLHPLEYANSSDCQQRALHGPKIAADSLTKNVAHAHDSSIGRLFAPNILSFADAVKLSMDIAKKSWQNQMES